MPFPMSTPFIPHGIRAIALIVYSRVRTRCDVAPVLSLHSRSHVAVGTHGQLETGFSQSAKVRCDKTTVTLHDRLQADQSFTLARRAVMSQLDQELLLDMRRERTPHGDQGKPQPFKMTPRGLADWIYGAKPPTSACESALNG